jgi:hypothetical protein
VIDEKLSNEIRVIVIATGFGERRELDRRTSLYSPRELASAVPLKDVSPEPLDLLRPPRVSTTDAPPPPADEREPLPAFSTLAAPVLSQPPPELPLPDISARAAPVAPPAAPNSVFNGNGKPVRPLGLLRESILDLPAFKRSNRE